MFKYRKPVNLILLGVACLLIAAAPAAKPVFAAAQAPRPQSTVSTYTVYLPLLARAAVETPGDHPNTFPTYEAFVASVSNGQAGMVRGVYVPDLLALRVEQQPANDPMYVSAQIGIVTQFQLAAQFGVTGLLAHDFAAGALFLNLTAGQEARMVYGDGAVQRYRITDFYRFQVLEPNNPDSSLIDLDTGATQSVSEVFERMYTGSEHVTFQTCINRAGQATWGRLFVVAMPLD